MFTFPRTVVVPAFVFGLAIATVQGQALAANPTDTMSAEELADYQGGLNAVTIVTQTPAGSDD